MSQDEKRYWRSQQDYDSGEVSAPELRREFIVEKADELHLNDVDRRGFLGLMGASTALAGVAVSGCIRKPIELIVPYAKRPEDLIPGKPRHFRTAFNVGDAVLGLHVESQDGRPTKVEGNPDHPLSQGRASGWAQASVLNLYDPNRTTLPAHKGEESSWVDAWKAFDTTMAGFAGQGGGLAILVDGKPSPTRYRLLADIKRTLPKATTYRHDVAFNQAAVGGMNFIGAANHTISYDLSKANVIVALDSDALGFEGDATHNAGGFAAGRRLPTPTSPMNRLYTIEPGFSVTGMSSDNRLRMPASHIGEFLRGLAGKLLGQGADAGISGQVSGREKTEPGGLAWSEKFRKFVDAIAADLTANKGKSAIVVGERQPAWVHGLAAFVNDQLGNTGTTVNYAKQPATAFGSLAQLTTAITAGQVNTLVIVGSNPVYDAPSDLQFADALAKVANSVHVGMHLDETGKACTWHLPMSQYLESWGDLVASDGTVSVQQPLIAPLYGTVSGIQVLARMTAPGTLAESGAPLVRATLVPDSGVKGDNQWRRALHEGVAKKGVSVKPAFNWTALATAMASASGPTKPGPGALEINFYRDSKVCDGRFANNSWLQELPDPLSKLTWDNAALISQATANELGLSDGDMVSVSANGNSVKIAAMVGFGLADYTVVLPLGYGRTVGPVAEGTGFNVYPLRSQSNHWTTTGTVTAEGDTYELVTTQDHGTMVEPITKRKRPVVREATLSTYAKDPLFIEHDELMAKENLKGLWTPPNNREGQQWGMTIDLTSCTGCNACTVACQAENNIPVVGKARVAQGREMHWIRLDRYFTGDLDSPEAVVQPVPCMQCEMAPCESVCPVGATVHSPEGLNDMAYNRCIGTRYCANNCPFKVRRFNFFNFSKENEEAAPTHGMQKNPDVTVRFRGVMEKCTYCVQRINEAKIEAKRDGNGVVPDGGITPACVQTCPTSAIAFGDLNDKNSQVSRLKMQPRNYELLRELNLHARTSYLARIKNPNPGLVKNVSAG
ncbi:MAG: Fe-S-cluster-containing dehydrogenase component/anaerobic selenocysteine-containing dehydrogenase [Myxococcota bacterium]|jgi:Fe-S-cluster-containing dehydrogenase component/anaerobic selenocysteine-containing dehydrogenase